MCLLVLYNERYVPYYHILANAEGYIHDESNSSDVVKGVCRDVSVQNEFLFRILHSFEGGCKLTVQHYQQL